MNRISDGLLMVSVLAPTIGVALAWLAAVLNGSTRWSTIPVRVGLFVGFLAATGLAGLLRFLTGNEPNFASWHIGTWIVLSETRTLPIVWEFRAEFMTAVWLAVMTSLSWMTLSIHNRDERGLPSGAFQRTAGLVALSAICFVLSSSLLQSLFFWGAISWSTLAMIVWSASRADSIRMIRSGLLADIVFTLAVLLIVHFGGMDSFEDICSAEGLAAVGARNPPLPGLIGSLLIFSAVGRCGLFPCFGWHRSAESFHPAVSAMIYAVGYVPSGIWLLLKCQPILLTSEVPMALLGGLGTLGAVLGAFVACGLKGSNRLACLVAAQAGVMLTSLGSGLADAAPWCGIHQCSLSAAAFVLFSGVNCERTVGHFRKAMFWCAALSLAGAFPFLGGWSLQAMNELNSQPARWVVQEEDAPLVEPESTTFELMERPAPTFQNGGVPRWDWLIGLWIAQGMSTFAASMAAFGSAGRRAEVTTAESFDQSGKVTDSQFDLNRVTESPANSRLDRKIEICVTFVAAILFVGGLYGWIVSLTGIRILAVLGRLEFNQFATIAGFLMAWRLRETGGNRPTEDARWGSIGRLSHEGLYMDHVERIVFEYPLSVLAQIAKFTLDFDLNLVVGLLMRIPAWLGREIESLRLNSANFDLIVMLLGTASLLLALVLIS